MSKVDRSPPSTSNYTDHIRLIFDAKRADRSGMDDSRTFNIVVVLLGLFSGALPTALMIE
jgi:hypothetical protein